MGLVRSLTQWSDFEGSSVGLIVRGRDGGLPLPQPGLVGSLPSSPCLHSAPSKHWWGCWRPHRRYGLSDEVWLPGFKQGCKRRLSKVCPAHLNGRTEELHRGVPGVCQPDDNWGA